MRAFYKHEWRLFAAFFTTLTLMFICIAILSYAFHPAAGAEWKETVDRLMGAGILLAGVFGICAIGSAGLADCTKEKPN